MIDYDGYTRHKKMVDRVDELDELDKVDLVGFWR